MPLEPVSPRAPDNGFERLVLKELAAHCDLDGIVTNNVLLPHVNHRSLPNEQDLLVLIKGRVYTIDAKELWSGYYRGAPSGQWEWCDEPGGTYTPCTFMVHPAQVAFRKRNVVVSFLQEKLGRNKAPDVLSVIVVPDNADISQLARGPNGTLENGARMLFVRLSELCAALKRDADEFPSGYPATYHDLAEAFGVRNTNPAAATLPCFLNEHVRLDAREGTQYRPFLRHVYRGEYVRERIKARIEITPVYQMTIDEGRLFQAFRNNLAALRRLRHDATLRLLADYDTPTGLIAVTEWFSDLTLLDLIQRPRRLTWEQTRTVFRPVVGLLRAAHTAEEPIIHRRLDPACIYLRLSPTGGPPAVRVGGFFGAVVGALSTAGGRPDNPYLDPEARKDENRTSPRQDYYAVAQCVAAALTGQPKPPVVAPAGCPPELPTTLAKLTSPDASARDAGWARLTELLHG